MARVTTIVEGNERRFLLGKRPLENGAELLLRLRGNQGWTTVTVEGLPRDLRIRCTADDGKTLVTSLPTNADVRWPDEPEQRRDALVRSVP